MQVWLPDRNEQGTVVKPQGTRSYIVESESQGTDCRNRKMILPMPSQNKSKANTPKISNTKDENNKKKMVTVSAELKQVQPEQATQPVTVTQTRSGHISKPPDHLVESDD